MKIIKADVGALNNFEVLMFLKSKGASSNDIARLAKVKQSEYKVFDYLDNTPAGTQTKESVDEFKERCGRQYKLGNEKILNIINTRPASVVEIYAIVEDNADELVELVTEVLTPATAASSKPEADFENLGMKIFIAEEEEAFLNEVVMQYGNVKVTNRELRELRGPHFLNDSIIEFYFSHITNTFLQSHESFLDDILLVLPALSYLLQHESEIKAFVEYNNVASKQVVIFPVNNNRDGGTNDGGSHWSSLVYYRKSNTFVHYDSLGTNGYFAKKLFRAVKKYVATPAETSSTIATITDGHEGYIDANAINIRDVDSSNTSPINGGGDDNGDSTMIDGDFGNTSRIDGDCTIYNRVCWNTRIDSDEKQLKRNRKIQNMFSSYRRRCPRWDRDGFGNILPRGYQYHDEDDSFKEEGCMPKQQNYYDCGLYVMEIARVVCEWYYLDEEAKQKQPEHPSSICKLGGGGLFPNISECIHTSIEFTMRKMLLNIIQQHAHESGINLDLFSDDDVQCKDDDLPMSILSTTDSKEEETPLQFGLHPQPQDCKSEDETLCDGIDSVPQSIHSTSKDEPNKFFISIPEDKCSLFNKSINYLEGDKISKEKQA